MPPTRDLTDRDDVAEMVLRFYRDVAKDDLLGPMFTEDSRGSTGLRTFRS